MDPVFRVLSIWSRRTDDAIYKTLMKNETSDWFTGFLLEFILFLVSSGYLYVRFFQWGIEDVTRKDKALVIAAAVIFLRCSRALYVRARRRFRFSRARDASRKAKASASDQVLATLFFSDHLMHYGMAAGKSSKLSYDQIHEIRYSRDYIFLITANTDGAPVCLERAGFVGMPSQEALRWLARRCKCKPRR